MKGIAVNVREVQEQIGEAAARAGRRATDITLVAVSKKQPLEALYTAYDEAGVRDFGENIASEMHDKAIAMAHSRRDVRWHFIGRLQRNKVKSVLQHAYLIHSVDRGELVETLAQSPVVSHQPRKVLIQVNIGDESQKGGVPAAGVFKLAEQLSQHDSLQLVGLMAVPPADLAPRPYFEDLATLHKALQQVPAGAQATVLSMGMSHDFVTAIDCGATLVRVGSAIFGARPGR